MTSAVLVHMRAQEADSLANVRSSRWENAWTVSWSSLADRELVPGSKVASDDWVLPLEWASGGHGKGQSQRTVRFSKCLPATWERSEARSEAVIRRLKRIAILIFAVPARFAKRSMSAPRPTTWRAHIDNLTRFARDALEEFPPEISGSSKCAEEDVTIFAHLLPEQLIGLLERDKGFWRTVAPRLNAFKAQGLLEDWPADDVAASPRETGRVWQPFDDGFLAEFGRLAIWTADTLGPPAIECWAELIERAGGGSYERGRWYHDVYRARSFPKLSYPYQLKLRGNANRVELLGCWPPENVNGVRQALALIQMANATILYLSLGLRVSEMAELRRDCLRPLAKGAQLEGMTFKESEQGQGSERRWPLPAIALRVLSRQQQLAELLNPGGDRLFVPAQGPANFRIDVPVANLAKSIRLLNGESVADLCEGNIHTHRFRKSVARLVALTLVGGGQILYELFGHHDPEMTIGYMLADPELQDEIRQITREAAIVLAKEALTGAEGNGGPAAATVRDFAARVAPRLASEEMGVEELERAARILSQDGRVLLVRRNVLCTKTDYQAGPCTKRAGAADAGRCDAACGHRLELRAAHEDHVAAIEQILAEFDPDDPFGRVWWRGQLEVHLSSFPEIAARYASDKRAIRVLKPG